MFISLFFTPGGIVLGLLLLAFAAPVLFVLIGLALALDVLTLLMYFVIKQLESKENLK